MEDKSLTMRSQYFLSSLINKKCRVAILAVEVNFTYTFCDVVKRDRSFFQEPGLSDFSGKELKMSE